MTKYRVAVSYTESIVLEISASCEEEAEDKANDLISEHAALILSDNPEGVRIADIVHHEHFAQDAEEITPE